MNKVPSLSIEKEKRDRPMSSGKGSGKGIGKSKRFGLIMKRTRRKVYLPFGSEQDTSAVLFSSE